MHSAQVLSAILAFGAAAVSAESCSKDITITELNQAISCEVVDGSITISPKLAGDVTITGPKQIKGDLIVKSADGLTGLSSDTINAIGGKFQLQDVQALNKLVFGSLHTVDTISLVKVPDLTELNLGTEGVTKINSIRITDTYISDISGLSVATVQDFEINDNSQMTSYDSDIVNITGTLIINNNGNNMQINFKNLERADEIQISNVKTFTAPKLKEITASVKFNDNAELKSLALNNVTTVGADIFFADNNKLTNISMPLVTECAGFTIQNNTALQSITGFNKLQKVGAINLRGDFKKVQLPALNQVAGTVTVTSTAEIGQFCDPFHKLENDNKIKGKMTCTSHNKAANSGGNGGTSDTSSSSSSSSTDSSSSNKNSAAGLVSVNLALAGLAGLFAVSQLF